MYIFISIFIALNSLQAFEINNSFITKYEYGQMLYKSPRGVGCHKCHGQQGKGEFIASYEDDDGKIHTISAPDITNISVQKFESVLTAKKNKSLIMPTYFLTQHELQSLYYFLSKQE